MISWRTGEEKPWISSAGGMPLDWDLDMIHDPLRSRRLLLALRGLDLKGDIADRMLDSRDANDLTDGVEAGESSKWSKSGSCGKRSSRVLDIPDAARF